MSRIIMRAAVPTVFELSFYQEISLFSLLVTILLTRKKFIDFLAVLSLLHLARNPNVFSSQKGLNGFLCVFNLFVRSGFLVSPSTMKSQLSSITTPLQRIPLSLNIQTLLLLGP